MLTHVTHGSPCQGLVYSKFAHHYESWTETIRKVLGLYWSLRDQDELEKLKMSWVRKVVTFMCLSPPEAAWEGWNLWPTIHGVNSGMVELIAIVMATISQSMALTAAKHQGRYHLDLEVTRSCFSTFTSCFRLVELVVLVEGFDVRLSAGMSGCQQDAQEFAFLISVLARQ